MALLQHDRMVINQKAKLIEMVNKYLIRDTGGSPSKPLHFLVDSRGLG